MNHIAIIVIIRDPGLSHHPQEPNKSHYLTPALSPLISPARALKVSGNIASRNITPSEVPALEFAWQPDSPGREEQSSSPPVTPFDFSVSPLNPGMG